MGHQGECEKYYFLHGRIAHRQTKGVGVPFVTMLNLVWQTEHQVPQKLLPLILSMRSANSRSMPIVLEEYAPTEREWRQVQIAHVVTVIEWA
jgi:hypothetical protein